MALGCPVVSSALPGLAGVLENGVNALLVPAGSPEALADGLRHVSRTTSWPTTCAPTEFGTSTPVSPSNSRRPAW